MDEAGTPTHIPPSTYHPTHITTLALIKRITHLNSLVLLYTQLHLLSLLGADEMPYKYLHAVVTWGAKPWFDMFIRTRVGAEKGTGG